MEAYLELQNPKVKKQIAASRAEPAGCDLRPSCFQNFYDSRVRPQHEAAREEESDIPGIFKALLTVLAADPRNTSRQHNIKKLTGVELGDGQWRIRSGVYRLRYDIREDVVTLHSLNQSLTHSLNQSIIVKTRIEEISSHVLFWRNIPGFLQARPALHPCGGIPSTSLSFSSQ
jgi:mRNA-degrading endonuclease RelE of RelBE toxin-antitoxin system